MPEYMLHHLRKLNTMNWREAETILDKSLAFTALPINATRTDKSYTSGYTVQSGRHIVLERRGDSDLARMFFELPFDTASLDLSTTSVVKIYSTNEKRVDIGRASKRLAIGNAAVCIKVATSSDLSKIMAHESGASQETPPK